MAENEEMFKALVRGRAKKIGHESDYIDYNLRLLGDLCWLAEGFNPDRVRPSTNARNTIDVCISNKMAIKVVGHGFYNQLLRTFETDINGSSIVIVVDQEDLHLFDGVVRKYEAEKFLASVEDGDCSE